MPSARRRDKLKCFVHFIMESETADRECNSPTFSALLTFSPNLEIAMFCLEANHHTKKPRLRALLSRVILYSPQEKQVPGGLDTNAGLVVFGGLHSLLSDPRPPFWPVPPPRGTRFPEHMAQQIAMEFPTNTRILLLSSCFGDLGCIYMVLVNAKDNARNVVLTPPSLPPILVFLIQEWARLHPS